MLAIAPDLPRGHFLRYLHCLKQREYQGAVDSLHTYFDYGLRRPVWPNVVALRQLLRQLCNIKRVYHFTEKSVHCLGEYIDISLKIMIGLRPYWSRR